MICLVMGVTGSGKSTVGRMLAERLGWVYLEADDFHSASNKEKMHKGIPLTEADRLPWLEAMHQELQAQNAKGKNVVLACSALREEYRRILMADLDVKLIYLRGSRELIAERLRQRTNHFAGESILGRPVRRTRRATRCDDCRHHRGPRTNRRRNPARADLRRERRGLHCQLSARAVAWKHVEPLAGCTAFRLRRTHEFAGGPAAQCSGGFVRRSRWAMPSSVNRDSWYCRRKWPRSYRR